MKKVWDIIFFEKYVKSGSGISYMFFGDRQTDKQTENRKMTYNPYANGQNFFYCLKKLTNYANFALLICSFEAKNIFLTIYML